VRGVTIPKQNKSSPDLPPAGIAIKEKIIPTQKLKGIFWTKMKPSEIEGV
jgi:hypothetical protein